MPTEITPADITDTQLHAFLAGSLKDPVADAIAAAINADPELAARAEHLAQADDPQSARVRDAFAPVLKAEVPERLIAAVQLQSTSDIIDFAAARNSLAAAHSASPAPAANSNWRWPQFGAMAASLALGVMLGNFALGSGNIATQAPGSAMLADAQGLIAAAPVNRMLDASASGEIVQLAGLGEGEVVLTFRNFDADVCRQFALRGEGGTSDAVACRSSDQGQWRIEAFGRRAAPIGEMRTASGDSATAVISAVDEMIAGEPLVAEDERAALGGE